VPRTKYGDVPVGMAPIAKTQTPDSLASNAIAREGQAITMRGQNMTDSRSRDANMNSSGAGKPPAGYRFLPDGSLEFIPGGPADQKAQLQKSGEGTVGSVVADLRDRYNKLQTGGGIVESGGGVLGNIGAFAASTGAGQTLGSMFGTKNQGERDSIAMTRPLLLQAIMRATGMSAKQMDSNAELKLYLSTATDPTKGVQANRDALERIEKLYGGGASSPKPSAPASNAGSPQDTAAMQWAKSNPNDPRSQAIMQRLGGQ
jgi:hypothetical protein